MIGEVGAEVALSGLGGGVYVFGIECEEFGPDGCGAFGFAHHEEGLRDIIYEWGFGLDGGVERHEDVEGVCGFVIAAEEFAFLENVGLVFF